MMTPGERFDPEGRNGLKGSGFGSPLIGMRGMDADNGSLVMNSPGFGLETELSGESAIERVRVVSCVESKGQTGSIDPVMAA
jgi:hypothetical protein